ncbi:MAG: hypothetical protein U0235_22405 [Polyangiaceae bacterium]
MKTSLGVSSVLVLATLALGAVACSNAQQGEDDSTAGALAQGEAPAAGSNAHLASIGKCGKAYDRASNQASSTAAMLQASGAYTECVKKANDAVVATIEKNLTEASSSMKGQAAGAIAKFRQTSQAVCAEMDKASPNFGGSLQRVESVGCGSAREAFLASLVDEFVALGDEAHPIKEDRGSHPRCYRQYDKRLDSAMSQNDMTQTVFTLAECVARRADALSALVSRVQVQNDAAAGPANTAEDRVRAATAAAINAGGELCAVLNEAGENGGGSLARMTTGSCKARVAESFFSSLKSLLDEG